MATIPVWSLEIYEASFGQIGATGAASVCDINNNARGPLPVNSVCFNSGSCVVHLNWQDVSTYSGGKCECADPAIADNFAEDNEFWIYGQYTGALCQDFEYNLYSTISYIIYHSEDDPLPGRAGIQNMFECNVGGGSGVAFGQTGWETIPDMSKMVNLMINYPEDTDLKDPPKNYRNYPGIVMPYEKDNADQRQHCKICSLANPCTHPGQDPFTTPTGSGGFLMVTYATNFNTYYDHSCAKPDNSLPLTSASYTINPDCDTFGPNFDKGYAAVNSWNQAVLGDDGGEHHREHYLELTQQPTATPVMYPTVSDPEADAYGFGWDGRLSIPGLYIGYGTAKGKAIEELSVPTNSPTDHPTLEEPKDDCFTLGYTHQISDLEFEGVAQAGSRGCRWGLETFWPGGNTPEMCDSPYVICLPQENTPNVGFPVPGETPDMYKSATHIYSLEECKKECAYDQRCVGFEFNPTTGQTGECVLLDDVPMVITDGSSPRASPISTEDELMAELDWTSLGGSICYTLKPSTCNPYFTEDMLDEVMLNCYCPNNRKGFYTKNVIRTVAATRFCGNDPDGAITKRIREAQANRMFHLCENWCLFNTQSPREESWYHDPWRACWREQYAGIGTHRSYCYRVIRDPYTIEQLFIDTRSANMCDATSPERGSRLNTPAPTDLQNVPPSDMTYVLAIAEDSCDDACDKAGFAYCTENTALLTNQAAFAGFGNPFTALGVDCGTPPTYVDGQFGWAHPSVGPEGQCILRNSATVDTGCNVAIGVGYRRICSCSNLILPITPILVTG